MSAKREIMVNERNEIIGYKYWYDRTADDMHRASSLFVVSNIDGSQKVLIAQRKWSKKYSPGKWASSAAGTHEEGEDYDSNIYKEAEEEIGLTGAKFTPIFDKPQLESDGNHKYFAMRYVAIGNWDLSDFTPQESEVEALALVDIDELLDDTLNNPDKYVLDFHDRVVKLKEFLEKKK